MTPEGERDMGDPKKAPPTPADDDVIPLEDLAPRRDPSGGRKITLGESVPSVPDGAPASRER